MADDRAGIAGSGGFAAWSAGVVELCQLVEALAPTAASLGVVDPSGSPWHGALFGKLRPQVSRGPLLVVAVCGGTNTGKSLIANTLVGAEISRSLPEAARTRHPVASLPRGLAGRLAVAELFPGFVPVPWTGEDDALAEGDDNRLVWREDPTGGQPDRLVLLDTPDIDGTLRENWQRAELVRHAADVLVAVLTQQKYNDATVRDFFAAAARARKTVLVVFNMVAWPQQRERIAGWLATFTAETGVIPAAVYAAPHDFAAAEAGRIAFHPLPELTPDGGSAGPAERLAGCDFDRIKFDAMAGALGVVLDPREGLGGWLDAYEAAAGQWREARRLLEREGRVRVELPTAPREIVWNEIWTWLEPRRSGFDLAVSRVYRVAGRSVGWAARRLGLARSDAERREDFSAVELAALKQALADFVERLDDACRRDPRLAAMLGPRLATADRAAWYADLERRHAALPMVSEDYRTFVRGELDRFARENPQLVGWILAGLNVGAVARPAITVGLGLAGAAVVPAAAATAGGLTTLVHHVGDVVVGTAATLAGEGALGLTAAGLKPLIETLFAGWSAERGRILAETLHDVVLGDRLEEIDRLASAAARPEVAQARRLLVDSARECGRP
ncbi:MAG: GTPase [Planctomycetia bacterium]